MKCIALAVTALALAASLHHMPANAAEAEQAASRFSVTTEGKGQDVIFIPGLASGRDVWDGAVANLGGKYRVHRLQLGGFAGEPVGTNGDQQILKGVVEQLHAYIGAHHLKRPAVVGHSMGGAIALMLAEAHPEDVGRVMIVDALPFGALMFSPNPSISDVEPQAAGFRAHIATAGDDQFRAEEVATMAALATGEADRKRLVESAMRSDRKVVGQAMYEILTTDARSGLPDLKVPLTIVYASGPNATGADAGDVFKRAYASDPNATLVPISDSRHFIMLDQPQKFDAALTDFLSAKSR
jgi:pimeloyl-[acyl-carrier protein] methyl ester esterase